MPQFSAKINFKFVSNVSKIGTQIQKTFKNIRAGARKMAAAVKDNVKGFAQLSGIIKRGMLVGLAAMSIAFGIATASALKYDKSLRELSAITGLAGKELEKFGDIALQSSIKFGTSASEYLNAVKLVASAKPELLAQPKLLRAITDEAAILAKASGIDLAVATNALTASMNQFGLEADQARRAVNVLAAGSKRGASEVGDTALALIKSGVAARLANQSFEQTNAAIQILASRSIKGALAGTTLRSTYIKMAGIISKSGGAIKNVSGLLDLLAPRMKDVNFLTKEFGIENVNAIQILIENRKQLKKMTKDVTGTKIAYEQAKVNMASFSETTKRMKQGLIVALMLGFKPFIKILQRLSMVGVMALKVLVKYPKIITAMIVVAGVLLGIMALVSAQIAIFTAVATGAAVALKAAVVSTLAFNAALFANPIGLIVLGVVALIAATAFLVTKWDKLSNVIKGFVLFSGIGILVAISLVILRNWTKIATFFKAFASALKTEFKPIIDEIKAAFKDAGAPIGQIMAMVGKLFDIITGGGDDSVSTLYKIAAAAAFVASVIATVVKVSLIPLRALVFIFTEVFNIVNKIGEAIARAVPVELINKLSGLFTEERAAPAGQERVKRAAATAARAERLRIAQKNQIDMNVRFDAQGRPRVDSVQSAGGLNFTSQTGLMAPGGA